MPNYQTNELIYVSFEEYPNGLPMVLTAALPDGTDIYIEDWAKELTVPPYASDVFLAIKGNGVNTQKIIDIFNAPETDELVNLIREVLGSEKISYTQLPESKSLSTPQTKLYSLQVLACLEELEAS